MQNPLVSPNCGSRSPIELDRAARDLSQLWQPCDDCALDSASGFGGIRIRRRSPAAKESLKGYERQACLHEHDRYDLRGHRLCGHPA